MRLLPVVLCATAVLTASCTGSSPEASPSSRPTASPSSGRSVDTFTALTPPNSPGVGSFDAATARRAHTTVQGLLTMSLAAPGTLDGTETAALVDALAVPDATLSISRHLSPPSRRGLDIRPLFARTVTFAAEPVEVVRSSYSADEVQGTSGERGIRITWDGAVRYRVLVGTTASQVAYVLHVSYIFGPKPPEPAGLQLMQVVPGASHAAPVVVSCLDKGLILPSGGVPTSSDFGPGPWLPAKAGIRCPV